MASLLLPDDDPTAPAPLLQLPDERPPSLQPDPRADALGQTYKDITDYMAQQHQKGVDEGYWTGGGLLEGGHPTLKAFNSATDEYAQGLLMGTTSSGGKYLKAYHGSPHKFDQFSDHAIGTGEGAQAYGYGHYLAENEGVARGYRDALAGKGQSLEWNGRPVEGRAVNSLVDSLQDQDWRLAKIVDQAGRWGPRNAIETFEPHTRNASDGAAWQTAMDQFKEGVGKSATGHMYEVRVNADPEKFLHWDKPLRGQHPDVIEALKNTPYPPHDLNITGKQYLTELETNREMATKSGDPAALASQALREAGIPGIRYLDAQSRPHPAQIAQSKQALADHQRQIAELQADIDRNPNNMLPAFYSRRRAEIADHQKMIDQINERMSEGTHNAVVFDPATMEIIRRYGLAGLMLGGGGLLSPDKQEQ
jgi:hypothetical protein